MVLNLFVYFAVTLNLIFQENGKFEKVLNKTLKKEKNE